MLYEKPMTIYVPSPLFKGVSRTRPAGAACPAQLIANRSITIDAPPAEVFPWIRQMGRKKADWYSDDFMLPRQLRTVVRRASCD
jgi:hypothetical protein